MLPQPSLFQETAAPGSLLSAASIQSLLSRSLEAVPRDSRILVLIPDHTRSLPLPQLFRMLVETLSGEGGAARLDFMVALGTHPPLDENSLCKLVGISPGERRGAFKHIGLLNHAWDDPAALATFGVLGSDRIRSIAGKDWHHSLPESVEVKANRAILGYDHIVVLGPTFPHEVVGFSGGAKYFFPGISGPEMINATHWLGALAGVTGTIGIKDTPVRAMIHAAAEFLPRPVTLVALVVEGPGLAGMFIGGLREAWSAAADLSAQRHIRWCGKPFRRVLSCAPPMYDELWTAAKAMYKLEPVVEPGGELVIFAPHLREVSVVHDRHIRAVGYHILPYFLENWDRFRGVPLSILAHSTHVRGSGTMEGGIEKPNVRVTLASRIPEETCTSLNLGYADPDSIRMEDWTGREGEGILLVPKAGETLYRLKP
jgi:nickel-dependent lactate racemase